MTGCFAVSAQMVRTVQGLSSPNATLTSLSETRPRHRHNLGAEDEVQTVLDLGRKPRWRLGDREARKERTREERLEQHGELAGTRRFGIATDPEIQDKTLGATIQVKYLPSSSPISRFDTKVQYLTDLPHSENRQGILQIADYGI